MIMAEGEKHIYTCRDYRQEMTLLALKIRLASSEISEKEKQHILNDISKIELAMGMR